MLLTPEQRQDALLRMESDLLDLHTIVSETVSNQARLTDSVTKLAGTVGELAARHDDLAAKHDALVATVDRMASKVDALTATVDRFIRARGDGDGQTGSPSR
jgi:outer membrane murein-binding lipoprotein Lpp